MRAAGTPRRVSTSPATEISTGTAASCCSPPWHTRRRVCSQNVHMCGGNPCSSSPAQTLGLHRICPWVPVAPAAGTGAQKPGLEPSCTHQHTGLSQPQTPQCLQEWLWTSWSSCSQLLWHSHTQWHTYLMSALESGSQDSYSVCWLDQFDICWLSNAVHSHSV